MKKTKSILLAIIYVFSVVLMLGCKTLPDTNESADALITFKPSVETVADSKEAEETNEPMEETTSTDSENVPSISLPEEYIEVLEDYRQIVEFRLSDDFADGWTDDILEIVEKYNAEIQGHFGSLIIEMKAYVEEPTISSYGYILNDLNDDETPELFWVSSDLNTVFAIFTMVDGEAQIVDAFWSRYTSI